MLHDLRLALRQLAKSPGFTTTAVLTLALGIGACTTIFTIVDAVLWRPLPYAEADRLTTGARFTEQMLRDWREAQPILERIETHQLRGMVLTGGAEALQIQTDVVSPGMFGLLGRAPALGRTFTPTDAEAGNERVAVLSHRLWQGQFGGDPDIVGREIVLNDRTYSIVGVMPRGFGFPRPGTGLWTPLPPPRTEADLQRTVDIVGRLRPGLDRAAVPQAVRTLNQQLDQSRPQVRPWNVELDAIDRFRVNPAPRRMMQLFLGAVGLVLLIAWANVANLLLVRGAGRQREFAVRAALGAGRTRLIRQVLAESFALAVLGATGGFLVAQWSTQAIWSLAPSEVTFLTVNEVTVDWRVLGFTAGLSGLATVLCGLVPAVQAARSETNRMLTSTARSVTGSRRQQRWQQSFVVAQIALAFVLLVGVGLLVRGLMRLGEVTPGFEMRNLVALSVQLPGQRYPAGAPRTAFFEQLRAEAAAMPGVAEATLAGGIPPINGGFQFSVTAEVDGRAPEKMPAADLLPFNTVADDYFQVMRIPLRRGRSFDASDTPGGPPSIVINDRLSQHFWPGADPIGQRIRFGASQPWLTVVGVAGDVKAMGLSDEQGSFEYYRALRQAGHGAQTTLVVRTAANPQHVIPGLRARLAALDPKLPIVRLATAEALAAETLAIPHFFLLLMALFAGAAILLAAIGLYGVMAYAVAQRTSEFGIRMALGALPADVSALVLRQSGWLVAVGLLAGVASALGLTRFLKSLLFEVSAHDPLTFIAIAVLLVVVAAIACWLPARRATRVDPIVALRAE